MLVIQFPYMETTCLSFFLTKSFSFLLSTIHRLLCRNKKILWKFDDTILAKCLKLVWLVFFIDLVYEIVWLAFLVFGVQQKMSEKGSWQEEQSSLDRLWIWLNKNIQNWDQICGEQHFNWLMIREENQIELKLFRCARGRVLISICRHESRLIRNANQFWKET